MSSVHPHLETTAPKRKSSASSKKLGRPTCPTVVLPPKTPDKYIILVLNCTMAQIHQAISKRVVPSSIGAGGGDDRSGLVSSSVPVTVGGENEGGTESSAADYQYKLRNLKIHLYTLAHTLSPDIKRSNCFWCTCPFTDTPVHQLSYGQNNKVFGKGVYCSPECACADAFAATGLSDAGKFEGYQLLNYCYRRVTASGEIDPVPIRPAPAPHYFLDKFLGNMTAEEFRAMNRTSSHLLYTLEAPITQVIPELHEDASGKTILGSPPFMGTGKYRVKRQSDYKQPESLREILQRQFTGQG